MPVEYLPDAQMLQFTLSVVYLPAAQEVQDVDPAPLYLPLAHVQQCVAAEVTAVPWLFEAYFPEAHWPQLERDVPAPLYAFPVGQAVQLEAVPCSRGEFCWSVRG